MACGACSGKVAARTLVSATTLRPARIYELAGWPDCADTYPPYGEHAGDSLIVVARGAAHERLYKRSQLTEASMYARDVRGKVENIPTTALCAAAVESVLG